MPRAQPCVILPCLERYGYPFGMNAYESQATLCVSHLRMIELLAPLLRFNGASSLGGPASGGGGGVGGSMTPTSVRSLLAASSATTLPGLYVRLAEAAADLKMGCVCCQHMFPWHHISHLPLPSRHPAASSHDHQASRPRPPRADCPRSTTPGVSSRPAVSAPPSPRGAPHPWGPRPAPPRP
ncbi:hypothetical protein PAPYR_6726 [Paratrimastix pyriformis]|uniref:Uncharacterized protein n=1 Tax=Paratrimastix pyriformis TaxID=342808 RepID=A0ABQ8UHN7_9EUKA|nr:hypothetical protein PAPYR_6726 [Paratrimastix pyriformis]